MGRLITEDARGEVQSYTYDANGNLLTMTDASGTTTRTYDKVGRLSSVTVGEETTAYEYYKNGNRSKITYPDQTTETYTYDKDNRITYLSNKKSDSTIISYHSYSYDAVGNQLKKVEEKGTTTYTYDNLNRLSSVTEPTGKVTSYTYDGAGNRKTETLQQGSLGSNTVYNYNNQNRLASTVSTGGVYAKYIYDNNGNLVSKTTGTTQAVTGGALTVEELPNFGLIIKHGTDNGTGTEDLTLYDYDNYNRLTSFKSEDTTATYQYNAQGYRVEKTVNGATTKYLYCVDKVVLETDNAGNQTAFMAYGSALLYRTVAETSDTAAQSYYYLYNAHGDVTALIDAAGSIAATYDYDAFGNMINETGDADNHIKYAGYQSDDENGLYYLNARYYDSVTARFITEDTYRGKTNDPLSLNLYTYCHNEPIMYTDPTGHSWKKIIKVGKSFVDGVVDSGKDTVNGVVNTVTHPVKTITYYLTTTSSPTYLKDSNEIKAKAIITVVEDKIINGTAEERVYVLGYVTSEVAQGIALDGVGTALKGTKAIKLAKTVDGVSDINKAGKIASNIDVWSLKATKRGIAIEENLAKTEYKEWYNIGQENNGYFDVIDFQKGNNVVSLKSIDLNAKSYAGNGGTNKILKYMEDLNVDIKVNGNEANKILDIRIPSGTKDTLDIKKLEKEAKELGITLKIKEYK